MVHALSATDGRTQVAVSKREIQSAKETLDRWNARSATRTTGIRPRTASLQVPRELVSLFTSILEAVANGERITVGTLPDELSTSVAAEQLGISRPTLMKLVASGELPGHKVGTHTRVKTTDVVAFRRARRERQEAAFEALRELEGDFGDE